MFIQPWCAGSPDCSLQIIIIEVSMGLNAECRTSTPILSSASRACSQGTAPAAL